MSQNWTKFGKEYQSVTTGIATAVKVTDDQKRKTRDMIIPLKFRTHFPTIYH